MGKDLVCMFKFEHMDHMVDWICLLYSALFKIIVLFHPQVVYKSSSSNFKMTKM